jgi:hypothetical protein
MRQDKEFPSNFLGRHREEKNEDWGHLKSFHLDLLKWDYFILLHPTEKVHIPDINLT